ncbi:MAG TPA: hypothetical protein VJ868_06635, partial [Actinomycetota bacterium]|nr:hypothetical protein [Actinomycetota bacterium]
MRLATSHLPLFAATGAVSGAACYKDGGGRSKMAAGKDGYETGSGISKESRKQSVPKGQLIQFHPLEHPDALGPPLAEPLLDDQKACSGKTIAFQPSCPPASSPTHT